MLLFSRSIDFAETKYDFWEVFEFMFELFFHDVLLTFDQICTIKNSTLSPLLLN